jgi:hypothetical protein
MWPIIVRLNGKKWHALIFYFFPKTSLNKMSTTLNKILIAKDAHAGGTSESKASILDMLIEATKDARRV